MKKANENEKNEIAVSRAALKGMAEFYRSLQAADEVFHSCQDRSFREHVRSCLKAPLTKAAYEEIAGLVGSDF